MSFEGYYQCLCEKGHYFIVDIYEWDLPELRPKCPICKKDIIWYNLVDETNEEPVGRVKRFKVKSKKVCPTCGSILEITYHIPKRKGHRIEKGGNK